MVKPVTEDQFTLFRNMLEERRSQLQMELQDEKSIPVSKESDSQDIELTYIAAQDQNVEVELKEQHNLELREIKQALQRIDTGHYGICQDCGASIDIGRLTAYPTARRCIDCKQAFEQKSGLPRNN